MDEIFPKGNERILFIDDEEMVAQVGKDLLEHLGYEVTIETSSTEALEEFRSHPDRYDLVITDQIMPQLTGTLLAVELMGIRPEVPIVIIAGYSDSITVEECQEMGIRQLVRKPLNPDSFSRTIRNVLDEPTRCRDWLRPDGGRRRIVVAEDVVALREYLVRALGLLGHDVRGVACAREVRGSLVDFRPDAVLLDWNLGDEPGGCHEDQCI